MTFDKSKVYTALNAEELEVGSEVILTDYLELLQAEVESNSWPTFIRRLDGIMGTSSTNRFKSSNKTYNLAYLVRKASEEKKWIVFLARYQDGLTLSCCDENYWETAKKFDGAETKLFIGSKDEAVKWCNSRKRFTDAIKAWEDGRNVQFRKLGKTSWEDLSGPKWYTNCEYRVKPEENWVVHLSRRSDKPFLTAEPECFWDMIESENYAKSKIFVGSKEQCIEWYQARQKFAEVIKAFEDGKTIQVRDNITNEWVDCVVAPEWCCDCEYRVKPNEDLYVVYVDHYEPHLDFGSCEQWDKIQEYKGSKNKLFIGSKEECKAWCDSHDKFVEEILAWENGKKIQFHSIAERKWVTLNNPSWNIEEEYRVKPDGLVWTDLKMGDILRRAGEKPAPLGGRDEYVYVEERRMVTGIIDDPGTKRHVQLGGDWIDDDNLEKWGVEE